MTDDKILLSHSRDLKIRCGENSIITATAFLDLRQRSLLSALEKEEREYVSTRYYGGYSDAERVCAVFIPRFYEAGNDVGEFFSQYPDENPLTLIRVDKDKFSVLSHRDYLGSLMGLGLKRDVLGDILCDSDGCFIVCLKTAEKFICENLKTVGRGSVEAYAVELEKINGKTDSFEEIRAFVASERLDNIVSAAFGISRTKSVEAIGKGIVFLNDVEVCKPDLRLSPGDKIVLRGKGKAIFSEISGQSKKGRAHIIIKKYK